MSFIEAANSCRSLVLSPEANANLSRRPSQIIIPNGPLTPPLSPDRTGQEEDAIIANTEPRYSESQQTTQRSKVSADDPMDIDNAKNVAAEPRRPLRLLEDEKVHLQRSGLRLSDFDVRGTLGWSIPSHHRSSH